MALVSRCAIRRRCSSKGPVRTTEARAINWSLGQYRGQQHPLDYDCPRSALKKATAITPGPLLTIAPLASGLGGNPRPGAAGTSTASWMSSLRSGPKRLRRRNRFCRFCGGPTLKLASASLIAHNVCVRRDRDACPCSAAGALSVSSPGQGSTAPAVVSWAAGWINLAWNLGT